MYSLSDTVWDVVICGTGLQQSLLALSLSRSDKKVLHIDPNDFYGGPDAALSLQEAEQWAAQHAASPSGDDDAAQPSPPIHGSARIVKSDGNGRLSFPRAYSLALAPQLIHARSPLVEQLVSSRAFRQLEFMAVGSFFILGRDADSSNPALKMTRIPSTREDVFSDGSIPARAKRSLMKFLKFVLEYDEPAQKDLWQAEPEQPLALFLEKQFKLDENLCASVLTLTLAPDGATVQTKNGLAAIHRHLTSMGYFGPGFAAVYPKWGGTCEIAQVACRAGAVGGGVYMLGTGIKGLEASFSDEGLIEVELSNESKVRTKLLVRGQEDMATHTPTQAPIGNHNGVAESASRLIVVVDSNLTPLFETSVEGAPTPAVAVIACPPGSLEGIGEITSQQYPVYVLAHSSDTGECPSGQTVLYLSTRSTPGSSEMLAQSLDPILAAISSSITKPSHLWRLSYEQAHRASISTLDGRVMTLPSPSLALAFDDDTLNPVREAWRAIAGVTEGDVEDLDYMKFTDREGIVDDDNE